ncbi:ABC transporter substrate-binding protein [Natronorubrum daqingense]|uniref:Cobalamin-binding protein n=1 Tax=Natronorubrum daqingense TaxID=588898 RepID=A0A1N7AKV1_9EURY|nr:ABC transporter substrate-binding protein [Natronorubrum daqingense]APX97949.1 cobalamin-binding protein [Natronorubrum daqingense]SIR39658.1 iron complex transport system substrate-binding protein [Natronorubrum daqingense]
MRIVTTLPSATELVAALGLEPVGVSHECDYPPGVESIPSVTASRIDAEASSAEIDEQVLEVTGDGENEDADSGVYDVDTDLLEDLEPDLIVTQGMCDVCAVDEVVVEDAVREIEADPEILTTDPHSVGDVLDDLERIGRATGREERARDVRAALDARVDAIRERTADLAPPDRPRVAIFDWTDPVMIAGHWSAELVEWAGGEYGLADVGERSTPREWADVRAYDPELVVVAPCGFSLEQTAENAADLTERESWETLSAVQNDRVWAMDGHHYSNRPGPRLVDTLEALAPIVRPEAFDAETPPRPLEEIAVPFADLLERREADAELRP